eukprot:TRINITY_DN11217_c0_g2_i1.p1 TRINITY_DN11217_c0_g2~~TRINITY_DN11217_c0_g2_i1.p1  ORF type:complete len:541 (+),score=82.91 TRINITY_DN11217_c0_g2_i1:50-1672(+)
MLRSLAFATLFVLASALNFDAHAKYNITYGGVLNIFDDNVTNQDVDILKVVDKALSFLHSTQGTTCSKPESTTLPMPEIMFSSRHILHFTHDEHRPAIFQQRDMYGRIHQRSLIMGITYYFTLKWTLSNTYSPSTASQGALYHHFVVTRDRGEKLSVLSHYTKHHKDVVSVRSHRLAVATKQGWMQMLQDNTTQPVTDDISALLRSTSSPDGRIAALKSYLVQPGDLQFTTLLPGCSRHGLPDALLGLIASRPQKPTANLKLLTYNIWNINSYNEGNYYKRIKQLAQDVLAVQADVVAFQEVRHDAKRDSQAEQLAGHLPGYEFHFQQAMSYPEQVWHRVEEGTAVFSKYPIVDTDYILLTRDISRKEDAHQRAVLRVTIDTPQIGLFHVFVSHFALDEQARDIGTVETYEFMNQHTAPMALCGDLNAEPETPAMQYLAGTGSLNGHTTSHLFDAWTALHAEPRPGAKYKTEEEPRDPGLTFNLLHPQLVKRIDYIFLKLQDDGQAAARFALDNATVIPEYRNPFPSSDHLGLLVELRRS